MVYGHKDHDCKKCHLLKVPERNRLEMVASDRFPGEKKKKPKLDTSSMELKGWKIRSKPAKVLFCLGLASSRRTWDNLLSWVDLPTKWSSQTIKNVPKLKSPQTNGTTSVTSLQVLSDFRGKSARPNMIFFEQSLALIAMTQRHPTRNLIERKKLDKSWTGLAWILGLAGPC